MRLAYVPVQHVEALQRLGWTVVPSRTRAKRNRKPVAARKRPSKGRSKP